MSSSLVHHLEVWGKLILIWKLIFVGSWVEVKTGRQEVSIRHKDPLKLKCDFTQIPNFNSGKLEVSWENDRKELFLKLDAEVNGTAAHYITMKGDVQYYCLLNEDNFCCQPIESKK